MKNMEKSHVLSNLDYLFVSIYHNLSMICEFSCWSLHAIIYAVEQQAWYKHIITDF